MNIKVNNIIKKAKEHGYLKRESGNTISLILMTKHVKPRLKKGITIWDRTSTRFGNFSCYIDKQRLDTIGPSTYEQTMEWITK